MSPHKDKSVISEFVVLTHPFFTASRIEPKTEQEALARDAILRATKGIWHHLVDRTAANPKAALVMIPAGNLGELHEYWEELQRYAKEKLGNRLMMSSKKSRVLKEGHEFNASRFEGHMRNNFKYPDGGVSIIGYGDPTSYKIPEPRMCLEEDVRSLEKYLRERVMIKSCGLGRDLKIPSFKTLIDPIRKNKRARRRAKHLNDRRPKSRPRSP